MEYTETRIITGTTPIDLESNLNNILAFNEGWKVLFNIQYVNNLYIILLIRTLTK